MFVAIPTAEYSMHILEYFASFLIAPYIIPKEHRIGEIKIGKSSKSITNIYRG